MTHLCYDVYAVTYLFPSLVTTDLQGCGSMAGAECGDPGTHPGIPSHSTPPSYHSLHWSRHLKCQVCFGYLRKPVTLCCGHSFCRL